MDYPAKELLKFILDSIEQIRYTFEPVESVDDLLDSPQSIMRLQAIGETIKNIQKHDPTLLLQAAPKEYWSDIARMRDIISHHYINIDAEIVYEVCKEEIKDLEARIEYLYRSTPAP